MSLRVLLLLSQMPQDPASGAARSMRTICEFLAASGMDVAALGTTLSESKIAVDPHEMLSRLDPTCSILQDNDASGHAPILRFTAKGVNYTLLETGGARPDNWEPKHGRQFNRLLDQCLESFRPDILFTYGGLPAERARRRHAREFGCTVVFGLRNLSYLSPQAFADVDAILTGSQFLTDRYRQAIGIESAPLPLPLDLAEVLAPEHERVFVTFVNPSIEKGVMFTARLVEELSRRRPDVPILVVESRAAAGVLVSAGLAGGFDLKRHENLMCSPPMSHPAQIFGLARMLVAPSVWEEPAGRVAAEALVNGVPPIVSNRGGLPEVCRGGGFVLPLPDELTLDTCAPVPAEAVRPWMDLLIRLVDDQQFYDAASARARVAGRAYSPEILIPLYADFFRRARDRSHGQR